MTRTAAAVVALVLGSVLLVGCSGAGSDSGAQSAVGEGVPDLGTVLPAAPGDAAPDADAERQVVTTSTAALVVDDAADGAQRVSELVEATGGRVEQRSEQTGSGGAGPGRDVADLVVRVPAEELTGLLADLEDLGEVTSVSVSRSDETGTALDLDARISALRTSVQRLEALLQGAATTEALLEAEAALSERQAEVESLQSQRARLADQVELSTLSVHLGTEAVAPPAEARGGFLDGLHTGWSALGTAAGVVVLVLGVLLPWLAVVAVLGGGFLLLRRRRPPVPEPAGPEA